MKQLVQRAALLALALCAPFAAQAQTPTDLFVSEYVEGSSNNKAIEIYNGTGSAVDLTAGNYVLQYYFNGSTSAGLSIALTGTVSTGDVLVVAQSSADAALLAQADQTNGSGWFNGDDAIVLRKGGSGGTVLDSIGQVGVDPGSEWGGVTADNTLRRKDTVCAGDTTINDAFDPTIEWDSFTSNTTTWASWSAPARCAPACRASTWPRSSSTARTPCTANPRSAAPRARPAAPPTSGMIAPRWCCAPR